MLERMIKNNISLFSRKSEVPTEVPREVLTLHPPILLDFSGDKTEQEVAHIIQSRVQLYLDENGQ